MTESPDFADLTAFQAKDPDQALAAARAMVRSYCGWHIAPSTAATLDIWSLDGVTLLLPTLNLTAVASLTQDASVVAASAYTFERYGVIRAAYGTRFSTLTKVTVAFTHGYATMPDDAANVILALAQRSISDTRGLVARPGTTSGSTFVETYGPQLTDADKDKLNPYTISGGFA